MHDYLDGHNALLERFRANARRLDNRAVYEIPRMLERIMDDGT